MGQVCPQARKTRSGKVEIPTVDDVVLRAMLFMVTWATGSRAQHEASKTHLQLAVECLNPTMFNCAETVTANMKRKITNFHRGETKQFGYGSILGPLMLEWVLALQLQDMDLDLPRPCETRATRWAHIMPRGAGGRPMAWGTLFQEWLEC